MSGWMLSFTSMSGVVGFGIGRRACVYFAHKRNDEEEAKEEFFSLVTVAEISPEGLKGLGTKVIEEEDRTILLP